MPARKRRLRSGKVRVYDGDRVAAKATTPEKAERQRRLLEGIRHGWKPRKK